MIASSSDSATAANTASRLALACCLVGFGFSVALALQSDAGEGDYDDLAHYLYADWSWADARYLIHDWGRPGFTVLYALPSLLGWRSARLFSGLLAAVTAYLAFSSARRLGLRDAWLAAPLTLAQPLFFVLSYTTLTETAAALYLTVSLYLLLRDRPMASAAMFSVLLVTRYEFVALLPLWALAVGLRGRRGWRAVPVLLWAPAVHNVVAWVVGWAPPVHVFFEPQSWFYGSGDALAFIAHLSTSGGLAIAVLALAGCRGLLAFRTGWLIGASVFVFLAVQTVLYVHGSYATGGYARFLVSIAPLLGIAATHGWAMLQPGPTAERAGDARVVLAAFAVVYGGFELHRWLAGVSWMQTAAWTYRVIAAAVLVACISYALSRDRTALAAKCVSVARAGAVLLIAARLVWSAEPLRTEPRHQEIADAIAYARRHGMEGRVIHAAGPWVAYFMGSYLAPDRESLRTIVSHGEPGELFLWDVWYDKDASIGVPLGRLWSDPKWAVRYIAYTRPGPGEPWPSIMLFERSALRPAPAERGSRERAGA